MVPELRGVYSQSRTLAGVEPMVREAISLFLDVPEDSFDVAAVKVLDPATEDAIRAAAEARKAAAERQREATARTREAVVALRRRACHSGTSAGWSGSRTSGSPSSWRRPRRVEMRLVTPPLSTGWAPWSRVRSKRQRGGSPER